MSVLRKLLLLTLPAVVAVLALVEAGVRLTWDHKRGAPDLFIAVPPLGDGKASPD